MNESASANIYERRVRDLEAFGHRGSASPHEHRAADYLIGQMRSLGPPAQKEPFAGARSLAARLLAHATLAWAGAALFWAAPVATVVLGAVALISMVAEQTTLIVLLSRIVVRFVSWNLWMALPSARPPRRRILLCAHYDTQHSGWVWTINRYLMPLGFKSPLPLKPPMTPVMFMMVAQIVLGALLIGIGHTITLTVLTGLLLAGYVVLTVLLVQWGMGRPVPGAMDNASGVAAVLELAESWRASPPADDVELFVLLSGCEESGMLGAAAWADRHRQEIQAIPTVFLNIDGIGFGPPRFLGAEVPAAGWPIRTPSAIVKICREAATELGLIDAGPHALPGPTDGLAFLARGIPGATIVGFRAGGILPHYHTMRDTAANMDFGSARRGVEFARALLAKLAAM